MSNDASAPLPGAPSTNLTPLSDFKTQLPPLKEDDAKAAQTQNNSNQKNATNDDINEVCEACCEFLLIITVQRHTKVLKKNGEWYATMGDMTMKKVRSGWFDGSLQSTPGRQLPDGGETIMESDTLEKFGPSQKEKMNGSMIATGHYGLATRTDGRIHDTYKYNKEEPGERKTRAMSIWGHKAGEIGARNGIDIHRGHGYTWSIGCVILGPKGSTGFQITGRRDTDPPNYDPIESAATMDKFVESVEDFKQVGRGGLPNQDVRIGCVYVIINEPKEDEWKTITKPDPPAPTKKK